MRSASSASGRHSLLDRHAQPFQQRFDEAAQELAIAEQAFKELGDRHGYLLVLRNLAFIDRVHSLYENAESRCREALSGLRA